MKEWTNWLLEGLQNYGLKITLWMIVGCSFVSLITKAILGKPSSAPVHYLLAIALVAAVLSVLIPNIESYLLSKISEIDIGGVKLVIAKAQEIKREIKFRRIQPSALSPADPVADGPFRVAKLEGFQVYEYEKLSHKIYQTFDEIRDPNELVSNLRDNYRDLIKHVATMAYAMGHYSKYLEIILQLELFRDRELTADELSEIGCAYLWAADEQLEVSARREYWKNSVSFLTRSIKADRYEVKPRFNLGIGHLYLTHYPQSIYYMKTSAKMFEPLTPWAKWNMACAYVRLKSEDEALITLKEIEKGKWWNELRKDSWFTEDSVSEAFKASFRALCAEKTS